MLLVTDSQRAGQLGRGHGCHQLGRGHGAVAHRPTDGPSNLSIVAPARTHKRVRRPPGRKIVVVVFVIGVVVAVVAVTAAAAIVAVKYANLARALGLRPLNS